MVVVRYHKPQPPASLASGHGKVVIRYFIKPQPPARLASGHGTLVVRSKVHHKPSLQQDDWPLGTVLLKSSLYFLTWRLFLQIPYFRQAPGHGGWCKVWRRHDGLTGVRVLQGLTYQTRQTLLTPYTFLRFTVFLSSARSTPYTSSLSASHPSSF